MRDEHALISDERENLLARAALRFTAFSERWLPDAFGFVLIGTFVVLALGLATGVPVAGVPADPEASGDTAWSTPGARGSGR